MTIPISAGDVFLVRIICQLDQQVSVNAKLVRCSQSDANPSVLLTELADAISTDLGPKYVDLLSVDATYRGVSVQRVNPQPKTIPVVSIVQQSGGLVVGNPLPPQTAGLVSLKGSAAGRRFQGRIYLPFPGENSNAAEGVPSFDYVVDANSIGTSMITGYSIAGTIGGSAEFVYTLDVTGADVNKDFNSFVTRPGWATQQRRGAFGRTNITPF